MGRVRARCSTPRCCTQVIAGHDPKDSTSVDAAVPDVVGAARAGAAGDLKGVRVGVVKQLRGDGYQAGVLASFNAAVEQLTALGAEVSEVDCPHFDYSMAAYYLILPSEVSATWRGSTRCGTGCGSATTARTAPRK